MPNNNQVYTTTFPPEDEGKVVHNGKLVNQSAATYTTNDTYDTTLINSVTADVSEWTTLLSESWGTPTAVELQQDMNLTNYVRLSLHSGDTATASRSFTRTSDEPIIGIYYQLSSTNGGYGFLSYNDSIAGTDTSYGGIQSRGTYTTPNNSTVYLWGMGNSVDIGISVSFNFTDAQLLNYAYSANDPHISGNNSITGSASLMQEMNAFIDRYVALYSN